jgi:hypothetical protein
LAAEIRTAAISAHTILSREVCQRLLLDGRDTDLTRCWPREVPGRFVHGLLHASPFFGEGDYGINMPKVLHWSHAYPQRRAHE